MDDEVLSLTKRLYAALEEDVGPFLALCERDLTIEYPASGRLPYGGT